ncbi:MAG: hypothetical protein HKK66_03245 [Chlorobiaceae bacterium]|nr:hypothetical protein [Chlorobiaceae bacterium]
MNDIAGLNARISVIETISQSEDYFGFAYNTYSDVFTRLGKSQGIPTGVFCPRWVSPIISRLRMVTLKDNGAVTKEISWIDKTKYTDGTTVPLSGTDGQVMVEYLPSYVKVGTWGNWVYVMLSHLPLEGFTLHPLFTGISAVYQATFEASVYNSGSGNKLYSIAKSPADGVSDVYPVTERSGAWGLTGTNASQMDALAAARGSSWQIQDFLTAQYQRLLMLAIFASYDIPAIVGAGRINLSGGAWVNGSYIGKCGLGLAAYDYYGAVQVGTTGGYATDYSFVLGIENPWGNVWERVTALISDHDYYYKPQPPYDYTTIAGWTRLQTELGVNITLPSSDGFGGIPFSGLGIVLPSTVTGSSSAKMRDYYYQAAGLRVLLVGGYSEHGSAAGPFCWVASYAASDARASIGGRLCFKKAA